MADEGFEHHRFLYHINWSHGIQVDVEHDSIEGLDR